MQFSVPQFTDVEDRIVAGLTFKQFGIIFGAGVVVFIMYTFSKSLLVAIFFAVVVGLPALIVAFGKLNGRPIYHNINFFIQHLFNEKVYVFRREVTNLPKERMQKVTVVQDQKPTLDRQTAISQLKELNYALQRQNDEQQAILEQARQSNRPKDPSVI